MHILLNTDTSLQINPNLGIVLAGDMEGWFMERYVNIFMNGVILDYVDNVSYAGIVSDRRWLHIR